MNLKNTKKRYYKLAKHKIVNLKRTKYYFNNSAFYEFNTRKCIHSEVPEIKIM